MNVCFETFGCRLNRAEALDCEAACLAQGHRVVSSHSKADVIVVRGCSVTRKAQSECERLVAHLGHKYPNRRVVLMGCLPGAVRSLVLPVSSKATDKTVIPTRTARAYLKVQDGCAGKCTFCIVPKYRGQSDSKPLTEVLDKAKRFIAAGYHEIVVTGCNLSLYASEGRRLPELVSALAALDPDCRIRLGSVEPGACAMEVIAAMAENANVCRYLHLPVQSGSNRILDLMGRPYNEASVEEAVKEARRRMPTIGLGCDLMTGFPGETEGDFARTRNLLTRLDFSHAHLFPYSERPGTPAAKMGGVVPHTVRKERVQTLTGIVKANESRFARKFIGREVEVVVESHHRMIGRTSEYLKFEGPTAPTEAARARRSRKRLLTFTVRSVDGGVLHGVPSNNGG